MSKDCYVTYICQLKQDNIYTINKPPKSMLYLQITNNVDKNDMVSQMVHAKNLGEPFMAHLENLYNIPCLVQYLNSRLPPNKKYQRHGSSSAYPSQYIFNSPPPPIYIT